MSESLPAMMPTASRQPADSSDLRLVPTPTIAPGGATFSIHRAEASAPGGALVYFECDDLDVQIVALKTAGVVFDSDPADQRWLWREARLRDPDGNRLCLYFAGENRVNPPWRVRST